jgi:CRP/FNR family transcriptional regulator
MFDGLDDEGARALGCQMAEVKLPRGEHLFMEGDDGDAMYVVLDGKMKLTRAASDGRENLLSVIGPGEMFGELSLFDPRPRTSSAGAVTDALLASLKHEDLMPWVTERPEVSLHMLRALAQWLRRTQDVTADLVFTDVSGRVAKNLLDLADRFGTQEPDGLHVHHGLTQEELAQLVGSCRRLSTRRWRTSPPAAGSRSRPARCSSSTPSACASARDSGTSTQIARSLPDSSMAVAVGVGAGGGQTARRAVGAAAAGARPGGEAVGLPA